MNLPQRKPTRLREYDYSTEGAYFITLCTQNREHIFEIEPVGNDLCVVPQNYIIHKWLKESENKFDNIKIDKYVLINNEGVKKLVDALGGVPVYIEKDMLYDDYTAKL